MKQLSIYSTNCAPQWYDRSAMQSVVEVDETYVGGATQGEGRGRHHKTLVGGIVEVRPRKNAPGLDPNIPSGQRPQNRGGHGRNIIAGKLQFHVLPNRKREKLEPFVLENVKSGTEVRTDGWTGYDNLSKFGCNYSAPSIDSGLSHLCHCEGALATEAIC